MTTNKTEDWAEIARELRDYWPFTDDCPREALNKAADLCERMARGELVDPGTCAQCKRNFNLACGSCSNR